ncbi:MAG: SpoIIE family protein phosphatase [Rikenellaceae bacterium]
MTVNRDNNTTEELFIDIYCSQRNCKDEIICGDTFLFKRIDNGNRSIIVLSDGMGHGVKANILSTLTASMIINFDHNRDDIKTMAEMLLSTLPICSVRKICYSTFTIIDINLVTAVATLIEYDNPACIVLRDGKELDCEWENTTFESISKRQTIKTTSFSIKEGDRIIAMSDGVTQSGVGSKNYAFGWKRDRVLSFIESHINIDPNCPSKFLAQAVVKKAVEIDNYYTKDDISCAVVTICSPKSLLLCSCPPQNPSYNGKLMEVLDGFVGKKVVCGYHLAKLISSLSGKEIVRSPISPDADVQPLWYMDGVEFITESLVTLNKVYSLLQSHSMDDEGEGAAYEVYRLLLESDTITILMGMSHENGGEYMVDEYELRRKVMGYIARILERKYMKEVNIIYN